MDDFARVKDAVDLVDVVARYVPLKRAGTRMVGLCPFHAEKSPSFGVKIGERFFKCFGCGKGGDVITFVAEIERIERIDALRRLAEEAGIALSGGGASNRDEKERVARALEAAQEQLRRAFASELGARARALLEARRLRPDVVEAFGLGFGPVTGDPFASAVIANRLVNAGHRREDVLAAGLAFEKDGRLVDAACLRERITIPIRDERGRVIAFGGRRLRDGEDVKEPKYVNSRETLLFSKSRVLYGLERARAPILKTGRVVLVEGYLDVILAHQAGLDTAIAALGTSVTSEHAKHLARLSKSAVLFLDGDAAGQQAAERAVPLLLAEGIDARVLVLRTDKDPGDFFARGASLADFDELLQRDAVPGLEFLLDRAGRRGAHSIDERIRVARRAGEALAVVVDPLARAGAVSQVARALDLPVTELDQVLGRRSPRRFASGPAPREAAAQQSAAEDGKDPLPHSPAAPLPAAQVVAEEELLIALLRDPGLRAWARDRVPADTLVDPIRARLFLGLVEEPSADPGKTVESLLGSFSGEPDAQQTLLDLVHRPVSAEAGKLFDGAMHYFERQRKKRESREIRAGFEKRLAAGDAEAAAAFLRQYESFRKAGGAG